MVYYVVDATVSQLTLTCTMAPVGSASQRGSFMSSQPRMAGSSLYGTPVRVFTRVSTVCRTKHERN